MDIRQKCMILKLDLYHMMKNSVQTLAIFTFGVILSLAISYLPKYFGWKSELLMTAVSSPLTLGKHGEYESTQVETSLTTLHRRTIPVVTPDVTAEALAALNLALEMESQGKHEKALKLYDHALALDPLHADILNKYGEFLEYHHKDIILAEHMYSKALTAKPSHTKALSNRKRTLPLVEEIDQNTFNRIDQKREQLFKLPENHPAFKRAIKESYFHHIYHTVAIEGNTMTLAQARAIVETRMAIGGKSIMEHNEVLGVDAAMSFINTTLVHRIGQITLDDILEIHRHVLGYCDPMEAGKLRNHQVFIGHYMPPDATQIHGLMTEFVSWLNSEEALSLHPIEFAALAHYKLVYIHPFYDGNGRTSRLLMNLILMQAGYVPVIIKVEEKHEYYQHLETANDGDVRPFIRFIATCTERMLDHFLWATSENPNTTVRGLARKPMFDHSARTIVVDP